MKNEIKIMQNGIVAFKTDDYAMDGRIQESGAVYLEIEVHNFPDGTKKQLITNQPKYPITITGLSNDYPTRYFLKEDGIFIVR